jgi:1-deoxy-D-xylulose-5-phosphate reductoisomerase
MPAVLNAANEIAVAAFLDERLPFTGIGEVIRQTMDAFENGQGGTRVHGLAEVRAIDGWARSFASKAATGVQSAS